MGQEEISASGTSYLNRTEAANVENRKKSENINCFFKFHSILSTTKKKVRFNTFK